MNTAQEDRLKASIRLVPDFPVPGIQFRDITPLLDDPEAFCLTIDLLAERYDGSPVDAILALEARGFIIGAALAYRLRKPFVPIRKNGRLPCKTYSADYEKEYGTDHMEIHADALTDGQKVIIVDDLLATGGTAGAACALAKKAGAEILEIACVIELPELRGRETLSVPVHTLVTFPGT